MQRNKILVSLFIILLNCQLYSQIDTSSTTWILDRTDLVGGYATSKLNELPAIIETTLGKSLYFDGVNKALLVKGNPLGSSNSFTIEIIFRPDTASIKQNVEQRYFHLRSSANDNRRIMMELRLLSKLRWTIDTFIKSETSSCALMDDTTKASFISHPIGPWYHVALVYENGNMTHYVDGVKELTGKVTYIPIENGQVSVGARQDPKSWFKGAIRVIKFTKRALVPAEFTKFHTTGMIEYKPAPNDFKLEQNYPNPFNPATTIKYSLQKSGHIQLKVYDILGREKETLVNEIQPAGNHFKTFNGEAYTSGVYLYKISAGSFSLIQKMILLR